MDDGQGLGQGLDNAEPVANNQALNAPVTESTPNERVFKQSELNEIVKRVKHTAVEDYKRLSVQQPEYASQKYSEPARTASDQSRLSESDIRRLVAEEAQRHMEEKVAEARSRAETDAAQRIVDTFRNKMEAGKSNYEDFDSVTQDMDLFSFPHVVQMLAEHVDNAADVLYELGRRRGKLATLELTAEKSTKNALVEIRRLSDSIKKNQSSGTTKQSREPLSQMRPSQSGADSGVLTASDYRQLHRQRSR